MINIIQKPNEVYTDANTWWMIYDESSLVIGLEPGIIEGKTSSPLTMVTSDNQQELIDYIQQNNLQLPNDDPSLIV